MATKPTPDDAGTSDGHGAAIDAAIRKWLIDHIHNSPVSRDTAAYNHLVGSLEHLRALILEV